MRQNRDKIVRLGNGRDRAAAVRFDDGRFADVDDEVRNAELERGRGDRLAVRTDHRRYIAGTDLHVGCTHHTVSSSANQHVNR